MYWANIAELTAESDTNWLLQHALGVYLWACLRHAAIYADDEGRGALSALYQTEVARINAPRAARDERRGSTC